MGTCFYLHRDDGKLFDLDKAYGLATYLQQGQPYDGDPVHGGWPCSLGDDLETLVLVLSEHQPYPDGDERVRWAQQMLDFAQGRPVTLFNEHSVPVPDDKHLDEMVIGERFKP